MLRYIMDVFLSSYPYFERLLWSEARRVKKSSMGIIMAVFYCKGFCWDCLVDTY
jgi:hypothetical protein